MSVQSEIERIKTNIAAAFTKISEKGGSVPAAKTSGNLAAAITSIPAGTDTSDATAAAGDILSGKTAYVKGAKVSGTMAKATQATPSISVSAAGLITASAAQSAGYVAAGTKSATQQLTAQAAKTVTPGTASQTAVASGHYTTGDVTVAGDSNLKAANIKEGVSIFGVTGSYAGSAVSIACQIKRTDNIASATLYYPSSSGAMQTVTVDTIAALIRAGANLFVITAVPATAGKTVSITGMYVNATLLTKDPTTNESTFIVSGIKAAIMPTIDAS